MTVWGNYLLTALRVLARNRVYAAINIGGLAIGLAGCLMILNYVRYESSYDSALPGRERVFQVQTTLHPPGQPDVRSQASPFPLYETLPGGFPQIAAITSISSGKTVTEHDGRPLFIEATTVDADFFKVFALPFVQGSAETALPDTRSIVLTESEAIRLFGKADVLGRTLVTGAGPGKGPVRVSGVLRDLPSNTSLSLGIISRRRDSDISPDRRGWGVFDQQHFVRLRADADAAAINAQLPAWKKRTIPPETIDGKQVAMGDIMDLRLVPIGDVHLGAAQAASLRPGGDTRALATFTIVALLTLGMAAINFINLTTARATLRAPEVALRKVLGARRGQLIVQFLGESVLISALAMLIALTIVELATPWIASLTGAEMRIAYFGTRGMLLPAFGLFVLTGLAGGIYPALYLSRFRPAEVLRANRAAAETRGGGWLRNTLVVVQFAIAIGLIASTIVIHAQTRFVEQVDPGFRRDGLIQIANAWRFTQGAEYEAAHRAMLAIPGVTITARTGLGIAASETSTRLMRATGAAQYQSMSFYSVDAAFPQTMGMTLLAGRLLGDRVAADRIGDAAPAALVTRGINVVVNRSTAAKFGYALPQAAIGQSVQIAFDGFAMVPATIVGVVGDTRFGTARAPIDPVVYAYDADRTSVVLVRYAGNRSAAVLRGLDAVWRKFEPEIPFEARPVSDIVGELYTADRARMSLFAGFALLAILIAALGLYSLAAFAAERRTKEIGIRKVLGASVRHIVTLLAWQFSKPVVLANLLAWPVGWWAMRDWLNGFDARIALGPTPFALAGLLALGIALVTVAGHALRVARANPIHALRYE